jgi:hypothetical protein
MIKQPVGLFAVNKGDLGGGSGGGEGLDSPGEPPKEEARATLIEDEETPRVGRLRVPRDGTVVCWGVGWHTSNGNKSRADGIHWFVDPSIADGTPGDLALLGDMRDDRWSFSTRGSSRSRHIAWKRWTRDNCIDSSQMLRLWNQGCGIVCHWREISSRINILIVGQPISNSARRT